MRKHSVLGRWDVWFSRHSQAWPTWLTDVSKVLQMPKLWCIYSVLRRPPIFLLEKNFKSGWVVGIPNPVGCSSYIMIIMIVTGRSALGTLRAQVQTRKTTPASLLLGMPMGTIQQFHDVAVTRRAKFWLVWRLRLPAETIHQLERVDFDFFFWKFWWKCAFLKIEKNAFFSNFLVIKMYILLMFFCSNYVLKCFRGGVWSLQTLRPPPGGGRQPKP